MTLSVRILGGHCTVASTILAERERILEQKKKFACESLKHVFVASWEVLWKMELCPNIAGLCRWVSCWRDSGAVKLNWLSSWLLATYIAVRDIILKQISTP